MLYVCIKDTISAASASPSHLPQGCTSTSQTEYNSKTMTDSQEVKAHPKPALINYVAAIFA